MTLETLLKALLNTDNVKDLATKEELTEEIQIEIKDSQYKNIREIYWMAGRTILRLETD